MTANTISARTPFARSFLVLLTVSIATALTSGCDWMALKKPRNPFAQEPVCVFSPDATKEEIIAHLNTQASQLNSWRSSRVGIRLKQPGMPPFDLSADMAVQTPLNFRLRVKSIAGEEADFGSNQERFWFWVMRADYPYVMTVAHEELGRAQRQLPIPFEPHWVMEAFGVKPIDPSRYQMENAKDNHVNLISHQTSAAGQQVMKMIRVDLCSGYVVEHALYDASSQLIARATMSHHTPSSETGIVIPYRLTLEWPQPGITMQLKFHEAEINPAYIPETVWELPQIAPVLQLGRPEQFAPQGRQAYPSRVMR